MDSDYTAITGKQSVTASALSGKKGKGRRKKGVEGSVKSSAQKGARDTRSVTGGPDVEEEDDEDGGGDDGVVDDGVKVDKDAAEKKMAILIAAFNDDQQERYNMFRRTKLKKETVRRITNQTLSQSVPPNVITTINGFTKVFIGILIEKAREVQSQYERAEQSLPSPSSSDKETNTPGNGGPTTRSQRKIQDLGPLLPDHLREALRRYKKDGEGGGVGVEGTSVGLGVLGSGAARLGGKRMFR